MTTISHVRGEEALPFYRWLAEAEGWEPRVELQQGADRAGRHGAGDLGLAGRPPQGSEILGAIEAALAS